MPWLSLKEIIIWLTKRVHSKESQDTMENQVGTTAYRKCLIGWKRWTMEEWGSSQRIGTPASQNQQDADMKWIIYHCKDHTPKDWRCCSRLRFCTLKVLNHILHSQSSQQGCSCESCSACSWETFVNHYAMPATRIWISNAPEARSIWFVHPKEIEKKNYKWNWASRLQNGFQTLGFYSSKSLWAVSSTLSSTSITATISSGTTKLVKLKCLEGESKFFYLDTKEGRMQSRTQCSHNAPTGPHSNIDYLSAHFPSNLVFLFFSLWSY